VTNTWTQPRLDTTENKDLTQKLHSDLEKHFLSVFKHFLTIMTWCNFDKQRLKQWISKHEIQFHIQTILHLQENIILFPFFLKCHVKIHYTIFQLSLVAFIMHSNSQALTFLTKPILKFYIPEIQCSLVDVWIPFQACIQITQLVFVCKVIYSTTWNKRCVPTGKTFQLLHTFCTT